MSARGLIIERQVFLGFSILEASSPRLPAST
jgi:hypothetical protein